MNFISKIVFLAKTYLKAYLESSQKTLSLNPDSEDIDVIVKGTTDPSLLCSDASINAIGIGKNNPMEKLDVNGNIQLNKSLILAGKQEISITNIADAVLNGSFSADTNWIHMGNGTISGGYGVLGAPSEGIETGALRQMDVPTTVGVTYKLTFTAIDANVTLYTPYFEHTVTPGTYVYTFVANETTTSIWFYRATATAAKVDDCSLVPIYNNPATITPTHGIILIDNQTDEQIDISAALDAGSLPDGAEIKVAYKYRSEIDHILQVTGVAGLGANMVGGDFLPFLKVGGNWYPQITIPPAS